MAKDIIERGKQSRENGGGKYVVCEHEHKGTGSAGVWRVADASWKARKRYLALLGRAKVMRRLQTPPGLCRGLDMGRVDRVAVVI